jgi:hypothetical protein
MRISTKELKYLLSLIPENPDNATDNKYASDLRDRITKTLKKRLEVELE